jgi:hypothetical protein
MDIPRPRAHLSMVALMNRYKTKFGRAGARRLVTGIIVSLAVILMVALAAMELYALAGGAGSSGGDDPISITIDVIILIVDIMVEFPFPINVIIIGIILGFVVILIYLGNKKVRQRTVLNRLPDGGTAQRVKGYGSFVKNNPDFDEGQFTANVRDAFVKIQQAWERQDLYGVRRFLSDGVYQRFHTQFVMMGILGQKNTVRDINMKNVYIDRIETDGRYDIIHTAIYASAVDNFVCAIDPSLNSGGNGEFVEYWSFLKRRGGPRKDLYGSDACPNCGAPLPGNMGEVSACASCGTLTNSGEFDWVLSGITQADDYNAARAKFGKSAGLTEKVRGLVDENEDFAVQLIEDKASNGYLQILAAVALKDPSIMRRFVGDTVCETISGRMAGPRIAYNRLFLNSVSLIGVRQDKSMNHLSIEVKASYQRVSVENGKTTKLDPAVTAGSEVIIMSRDCCPGAAKGSLYAHVCPGCGAPVENSLDVACKYCGAAMNSTGTEWIITDIMDRAAYKKFRGDHASEFGYRRGPDPMDRLYDVRDFALNNVMIILAADGLFEDSERVYAENLARTWGYDLKKIKPIITMAQSGKLVVRMPEDPGKRRGIFKLMKKAASIALFKKPETWKLLEDIRVSYNIPETR